MQDNTTITNHFLQDPWNPITHPISNRRSYRRKRHAELVASSEHRNTRDPIEIEENNSTRNDHYEKYDVEAIEIDSGLTGTDTDEDEEFYGDGTDENNRIHDTENDDEQDEDEDDELDEDHPASSYWNKQPKDLSTARWTLFKGIEMLAQKFVEILYFKNFCSLSVF